MDDVGVLPEYIWENVMLQLMAPCKSAKQIFEQMKIFFMLNLVCKSMEECGETADCMWNQWANAWHEDANCSNGCVISAMSSVCQELGVRRSSNFDFERDVTCQGCMICGEEDNDVTEIEDVCRNCQDQLELDDEVPTACEVCGYAEMFCSSRAYIVDLYEIKEMANAEVSPLTDLGKNVLQIGMNTIFNIDRLEIDELNQIRPNLLSSYPMIALPDDEDSLRLLLFTLNIVTHSGIPCTVQTLKCKKKRRTK